VKEERKEFVLRGESRRKNRDFDEMLTFGAPVPPLPWPISAKFGKQTRLYP